MKVKIRLRVSFFFSDLDGSIGSTDGNAATVGCTGLVVVHVAKHAGGLLLGFSSSLGAGVSVFIEFN
jgi:hypothetical protein